MAEQQSLLDDTYYVRKIPSVSVEGPVFIQRTLGGPYHRVSDGRCTCRGERKGACPHVKAWQSLRKDPYTSGALLAAQALHGARRGSLPAAVHHARLLRAQDNKKVLQRFHTVLLREVALATGSSQAYLLAASTLDPEQMVRVYAATPKIWEENPAQASLASYFDGMALDGVTGPLRVPRASTAQLTDSYLWTCFWVALRTGDARSVAQEHVIRPYWASLNANAMQVFSAEDPFTWLVLLGKNAPGSVMYACVNGMVWDAAPEAVVAAFAPKSLTRLRQGRERQWKGARLTGGPWIQSHVADRYVNCPYPSPLWQQAAAADELLEPYLATRALGGDSD